MDSRVWVQAAWAAEADHDEGRRPFARLLHWLERLSRNISAFRPDDTTGLPVARPNYDYRNYVQFVDLEAAGAFWGAVRVAHRGDLK